MQLIYKESYNESFKTISHPPPCNVYGPTAPCTSVLSNDARYKSWIKLLQFMNNITSNFAFRRAKQVFLVINWSKMSIENHNARSLAQLKFSTTDVNFSAIWSCSGGYSGGDGCGGGFDGCGCGYICGGSFCGGGVCRGCICFSTPLIPIYRYLAEKLVWPEVTFNDLKGQNHIA